MEKKKLIYKSAGPNNQASKRSKHDNNINNKKINILL